MLRRLSTFCSAVSLVVWVAVCVLWVRSYWVGDTLIHRRVTASNCPPSVADRLSVVDSTRGRMLATRIVWAPKPANAGSPVTNLWRQSPFDLEPAGMNGVRPAPAWVHRLGFAILHTDFPPTEVRYGGLVPHAALAVLAAVPPVWAFWCDRARRRRSGLCRSCCSDPRANPRPVPGARELPPYARPV